MFSQRGSQRIGSRATSLSNANTDWIEGAMGIGGMSGQEIEELEQELLGRLHNLGDRAGNVSLLRELDWDEDTYWEVRDRLVNKGVLQLGRGRGGSMQLITRPAQAPPAPEPAAHAPPPPPAREADLYEPVARVLRERWVKDNRFRDHIVEITARQGARNTGGTWTRPDITVAGMTTFPFVPGKTFDVVTFEVKPPDGVDVTAVYEALAHLRAATRAFVILHIPDDRRAPLADWIDRAAEEAKRHGIGLILVSDPLDYEAWDELVEARRHEPDPAALNDFIAAQLSDGAKEEITTWFR
jgi:hypothetical protein